MSHIVVVGSGIAGLSVALEAARTHRVTLVTKTELAESNTRYAQGGIAVAMFPDDSAESHAADTIAAAAGLGDPEATRVLCSEGPQRIRELIALGVAFDRHGDELARGLEAAHSSARVLHAGGDATGAVIEAALVDAVRRSAIDVREFTFVADLVVRGGAVRGIEAIGSDGSSSIIEADVVVLASGGAGQLFRHTTNPSVATGDGVAAAWRAGAVLADVEFYQFHPTALAAPGNFLVSEAVRGEGAVLLDASGSRFMTSMHPRAELAPRDVVARGIAAQMAAQGGSPVCLDATALGAEFLARRFPSIDRSCRAFGLDWSREPIPVTPAAHYWMGGVRTDLLGRTSIRGLFAVGEVSCTGVHGANRLASNSLLESLVFASRAAELLTGSSVENVLGGWPVAAPATATLPDPVDEATTEVSRDTLRELAWTSIGLYRDGPALAEAAARLATWRVTGDPGNHGSDVVGMRESANLLELARIMVAAAAARDESRGAHSRTDFPAEGAGFVRHLSWARRGESTSADQAGTATAQTHKEAVPA
ncbi:MAG: L-aspartate oxidase [Burkholderiaceae bacterium]|nr:L-aspartate oxidase [Microbacteriaceae bacterium]